MRIKQIVEQDVMTQDPSQINIPGYGTLSVDVAKSNAINRVEKALNYIKNNPDDPMSWKNAKEILIDSGILPSMMDAIINSTEGTR